MHLDIGAKEIELNVSVKQRMIGEIKGAPRLDRSHETEASSSFLEVDETWKSLVFWLECEIAQ